MPSSILLFAKNVDWKNLMVRTALVLSVLGHHCAANLGCWQVHVHIHVCSRAKHAFVSTLNNYVLPMFIHFFHYG